MKRMRADPIKSSDKSSQRRRRHVLAMATAAALTLHVQSSFALGPISVANVAAGSAQFAHSGATTIIHASNNAIINYNQFSIPTGQAVDFVQPNASSRVLNRVVTNVPSQIDGALRANGIVYLVNPAGVIFGPHSVVNVGDLYAAAGHLSNANFLSGVDHFTSLSGAVANLGKINAGAVSLLGASVINDGSINAPDGSIILASAKDVYLTRIGGLITVKLSDAAAESPTPAGSAGHANHTAPQAVAQSDQPVCAGSALALGIMNSGTLHATQIQIQAAGAKSVALVSGHVDASTNTSGQRGGDIGIQAGHIAIGFKPDNTGALSTAPAQITADGPGGGGTILIGAVPSPTSADGYRDAALTDRIGSQTVIDASALVSGAGGFIDTSGHALSVASGAVISSGGAGGGHAGLWQLDPVNLLISSSQPSSGYTALASTSTKPLTYSTPNSTASYWVDVGTINTALAGTSGHANSGVDVSVTALGVLELGSSTNPSPINPVIESSNAETLTLTGSAIEINSDIDPTGNSSTLDVTLQLSSGATGPISVNAGLGLSTNPLGGVTIDAAAKSINLSSSIYTSGGGQSYQGSMNLASGTVTMQETAGGGIALGASGGGDALTNSYSNSSAGSTTLNVTSSSGYIADNESIAPFGASQINLSLVAGGKSSGNQAVVLDAPVQTGGGYFTAESTGSGNISVVGIAGTGTAAPAAMINTGGGNATFSVNGGSVTLTGGQGGTVVGGDAVHTGAGSLAIDTAVPSTVTISGGAGGNATTVNGSAGGAGASVGGGITIGGSTASAGTINISGGAGGSGLNGFAGGAGGAGISDASGPIALYFSGNSAVVGGTNGGSGGGAGGNAILTSASNLSLNPSGNAGPVFVFNNFPSTGSVSTFSTTGSFTAGTGGTLQLNNSISTGAGLTINGPLVANNSLVLADNSADGISIDGITTANGAGVSATENGTGSISIAGPVGSSSSPLDNFIAATHGGNITLNNASITSSGGISLAGPIILSGTNSLSDNSSSNVLLSGTVTGSTSSLNISEGVTGDIQFDGNVDVQSLSVTGSSIFGSAASAFTTSQSMSFGAISLGSDTTLTDSGTAGNGISVGAVTGNSHSLTVDESGSTQSINLNGNISGVTALKLTGPTILAAGVNSISTTDGQQFNTSLQLEGGAVLLSDNSLAGISIAQIVNSAGADLTLDEAGSGTVTLPTTTTNSIALGSLTVTGSTAFAGNGTIATTAGQIFNSPISIAANQSVSLQDNGINGIKLGAIKGAPNGSLAVKENGSGTIDLSGAIGSIPGQPTLGTFSATNADGLIEIGSSLVNVGQIALLSDDPVSTPITNTSGGTVTIFSPVQSYTASGSGASLGFNTGLVELLGSSASTSATSISLKQFSTITDADLPIFSANALALESTGGNVIVDSGATVPATTALALTSDGGYVTLGVTGALNVKSLAVNAATAINIDNAITTTNGQTFSGVGANSPAINLPSSGQVTLSDNSAIGIALHGAGVSGSSTAFTLTESGSGPITLASTIGSTTSPLATLTVNSPTGGIQLGGANIFTSSGQTYTGPVTLSQDVGLNGGSGAVTLNNAVATGGYNLDVTADTIDLSGGSVTGSGNQTYTGTINVNKNTTLSGTAMAFIGTLTTGNSSTLSVNATSNVNFSGGAQQLVSGGLAALTVQAGGAITLGGNLSAQSIALTSSDSAADAITTGGSSPFIIAANSQSFTATGSAGSIALQSPYAQFTGYPANFSFFTFSEINKLPTSFSVSQASPITDGNLPTLNQFVTVTSPLFGSESVVASTSLNQMPYSIFYTGSASAVSPVISLTGQNDLTGANLSLSAPNSDLVLGASGQSISLGSLSINGIVNILGSIVTSGTSSNAQSYTGTLVLGGGPVLLENTGSGSININSEITPGTSSTLTITNSGGGAINLLNAIGSTSAPLGSLVVNVSNGSILNIDGGSILTALGQTYNGAVAIGSNTTLTDEGNTGSTGINILGPLTGTGESLNIVQRGSGINVNLGSPGQSIQVKSFSVATDPATINLNGGTIETTAGQTYTGTINVLAPTTLQDVSGGVLSFQGIIGSSILTVSAPTDTVDLTTGITPGGINISGRTIALPNGNAVTTSLGQIFDGSMILNGDTTLTDSGASGSAGIQLAGDINEPGDRLALNQGGGVDGVIGNGSASYFNLQGLTIGQGTILSKLGTLNLGSTINNNGDLSLLNSLLYTNSGGPLTLAGKLDLQNGSTLTAEPSGGTTSSDVISNATIGSISDAGNVTIEGDNVTVNGSIRASGQVLLEDSNQLMIGPFGITNFDFRPTSLLAINDNVSGGTVLLNPNSPIVPGLGAAVPDAATIVSTGGGSVSINGGVVTMGRDQKWTSLGSLAISGSTVDLGDLNVLGNLTVTAPTINMLTRGFGSLLTPRGLHSNSQTKPDGVDVVAGNINFSSMPVPLPAATPGGPPYPQFATPTGGGLIPGYTVHVFNAGAGGLTAGDLYSTVLSPGVTSSQKYYLDLQASGPVTTNVFDSFTTFAIPQIPRVKTAVTLSSSQRAVLRSAGINAKNPTLSDLLALSDGRAVFNDIPRSDGLILENPSLIDYYVTTARLPYHRTLAFIALYKHVFLAPVVNPKTGQPVKTRRGLPEYRSLRSTIHDQFRAAWARYVAAEHKLKQSQTRPTGFRAYLLHSPNDKVASADLRHLSRLIYSAYLLGLSPKALRLSTSTILAELAPEALSSRQFEKVILGPRISLLAAHGQ